jgi:hypothetical protein
MKGTDCELCPAILTDWNTGDWEGQGGNCDNCNWELADGSLAREQGREQQQIDNYRNN